MQKKSKKSNLVGQGLIGVYMKRIFFSILIFCSVQVAESSVLVHPHCGCGFFVDAAVEGIYVEEPDIGFYGLVDPDDTPAVIFDPSYLTARVNGTVGYTCVANDWFRCLGDQLQVYVSSSYFQCQEKKEQSSPEGTGVQIFGIDGGGEGGTVPGGQDAYFEACLWENHTEAMLGGAHCYYGGFNLYSAVGFGFIYRHQQFKNRLVYPVVPFDNGTITEDLDTYYRGVKIELGVSKQFCDCWTLSIVPTFGIYSACTEFCGYQTWGQSEFAPTSVAGKLEKTAYQGALRSSLVYDWCGYYFGGQAFVDYLSYVPGIFNIREDDDGPSHITEKNSFRYGGGFVIGKLF